MPRNSCGTSFHHDKDKLKIYFCGFGNRKSVSIAGKAAVSHDYEAKNGNLLKSTYANGWEVAYTYDNLDRVTEVKASKDGTSYTIGRYIYDKLGRVARFVDGQVSGKSCTYGYDLTDRLCEAVFDGGTAYRYTYDANGNLLSDGKYTYSWTKGSLLEKVTGDGLEAVYTYDASGIRTSKKVEGTTTEYLTAGGSVLGEKKNGVWQHYLYDGDGQLSAISYKGSDYYYIRDNLRTITGLVDANGVAVVNYRYDSWGRMLDITGSMAETLGKDNPYRYKGYCYDEETGMYYLKSRYYTPEICRFISADDISVMLDSPMSLWDKNLYVYCDNDPVNKKDDDGEIADFVVMGTIGAVANVGISFITAKMLGQDYGWQNVLEDSISGALCAIPAISMISNSEKYLKRAGKIIMVGKAAWLAISGYLKGYSLQKTALYMGVNLWLETPNFSGIVDPKIPEELIKQIGRNLVYELGFSSLRTGVNTGFDIASGNNNSKKKGNQSNKKNKSSNKWTPPANSGYKNKNGVVLIPSPIDYIINMSQLNLS